MEFLTPGQRLKKIRKELNMTQNDFTDDTMTRSYFGMIEVGKRNLNKNTAKLIMEKLRSKAKELNVEININENDLLMSREEEAGIYCKGKMENNPTEEDVNSVIEIGSKYGLKEEEANAYKVLGDIKYESYQFLDAFIAYNNSLEIYKEIKNIDKQCYLNNRLGMCKHCELDYVEALLYFGRAQQYAAEIKDIDTEVKCIFNMALTYKKFGKVEKALEYIELYIFKIVNLYDYKEKNIQANILKANCLNEQGHTEEAIQVLVERLDDSTNINKKIEGTIYNNLGRMYLEKKDFDNSLKYFNISEAIRVDHDEAKLSHTIIEKANLYIEKQLYTESMLLLKVGCDLAKKYNDNYYLIEGYYLLIDVYEKLNRCEEAEEIYYKIIDLVKGKYNFSELLKAYLKLTELYIKENKMEKANYFIKLSQNITGS
ncbi:helix-turn-helix domain-containing protein [Clostridium tunisiense]|uniref:helix-turn-helix domain-containing protein n=1 Tax=Clostridium tunisiense TaxID=219748 RepID=UPI0002D653A5|nr:helix-turn-helix transcriptional regulator [Clostridium tunisiense]